MYVVDPLENYA